jgi:hypothetical protein
MYAVVAGLSLAAVAALQPVNAGEPRGLYWRHFHRAVLMPLTPEYQARTLYLRLEKLRKLKKMKQERRPLT